jgi:hypothetical protein
MLTTIWKKIIVIQMLELLLVSRYWESKVSLDSDSHSRIMSPSCHNYLWSCAFVYSRFIFIAMEALDQLLVTCHAHSLNLFVESFLKMTQKLLECQEPDLQVLGTTSVCQFHFFSHTRNTKSDSSSSFGSNFDSSSTIRRLKRTLCTLVQFSTFVNGPLALIRKTINIDAVAFTAFMQSTMT